jgi:Fe-S cluster assembly protein SufD
MTATPAVVDGTAFREASARLDTRMGGAAPAWLSRRRRDAFERFEAQGLPGPRDEAWRNTPASVLARIPYRSREPRPGTDGDLPASGGPLWPFGAGGLLLVDGRIVPSRSVVHGLPGGVLAASLAEVLPVAEDVLEAHLGIVASPDGFPFTALNTALFDDAAVIVVPPGTVLEDPVHVLHAASPGRDASAAYSRVIVVAGSSSRVTVVETYIGPADGTYFNNAVTEIAVQDNALVEHYRVQAESPTSFHVGRVHAVLAQDARWVSHNVSFGAEIARLDIGGVLEGEGAECWLNGLYFADGGRHVDNHTAIEHAVPSGASHELYKGILSGAARAVFNGRIHVRPGAQQTDARQTNRNLLLSDDALVFTRPQLEIYANDVKCTHGATVGQIDADALFYLRSRGLAAEDARRLLIHAFASDVLSRMGSPALRERLEAEVRSRLSAVAGTEAWR